MPEQSEIQRRKALRDQLRGVARAKAEAELPASRGELLELFAWVEERVEEGCDHTFAHTLAFIEENNLDEETVLFWLEENGAGCDCEVLNVPDSSPAFR